MQFFHCSRLPASIFPRAFCFEVLINSCLLKSWGNCIYFSHRSLTFPAKRLYLPFFSPNSEHFTRHAAKRARTRKARGAYKVTGGLGGSGEWKGFWGWRLKGRATMQCKTSDKRGTESEGGYKFLQFFSFGNHLVLSLSLFFFFIRFFFFVMVLSIVGTNSYGTLLPLYNILMPP